MKLSAHKAGEISREYWENLGETETQAAIKNKNTILYVIEVGIREAAQEGKTFYGHKIGPTSPYTNRLFNLLANDLVYSGGYEIDAYAEMGGLIWIQIHW